VDLSPQDKERLERDLAPAFAAIGEQARSIDPAQPWDSPDAVALDAQTVAARLDELLGDRSLARRYLELVIGNNQCKPTSEQSYLGLLTAVSAHRIEENMRAYWDLHETHRCRGGNQQLAERMASSLRDARLSSPVAEIVVEDHDVVVAWGDGPRYECFDYVVLAAPPTSWPTVTSSPAFVPGDFTMSHGPAVKFLSRFATEFWVSEKLAPSALSDELGNIWESTDTQPPGTGGFGLSVYSGGAHVRTAPEYESGMNVIYPGYSANQQGTWLVDWPRRQWTMTGYSAPGPGEVCTISKRLASPFAGRLFFAGEQASPGFFGYMEGALQSGIRAAEQVAAANRASIAGGEDAGAAGSGGE
jgi:monoamine oxidase